ncbi:MAG: hypothetical protein ABSH33_04260 [Steroidobacteraceae bacterium]|jgi:hypothetical protein
MTQVIKFPDMRPPASRAPVSELPTPAQYRQSSPAIITAAARVAPKPRDRRRLFAWFGVAVALHAALLLAIWLLPPLRIPWSPSPDAWVQVISLPQKAAPAPVAEAGTAGKPIAPRIKSGKAQSPVESNPPRSP